MVLENDKLKKDLEAKDQDIQDLKGFVKEFEDKYNKLNDHIKEGFEKTVTFKHIRKIEELENLLEHRKEEIHKLNSQMKRGRNENDKAIKQKEIEYELLKMDYQSAIVHKKGNDTSSPKKPKRQPGPKKGSKKGKKAETENQDDPNAMTEEGEQKK